MSGPSSGQDPLVGATVDGRYTIERSLASGGMGSVYLARQKNLARPVAVKVVTNADPDLIERFRREAEALAEVAHPAIVEVYDFISAEVGEGRCYLVMSYVEGENLEEYLDRVPGGAVSPAEAVGLVTPIVSALVQLHASGIVHRDIKPANIIRFEGADGRPAVKLVDFGIARRAVDTSLTSAGYIIGTPPYMAPETLMAKPHTPLADVYALGATLFELVTGSPPHGQGPLHQIMKRALGEPARLPAHLEGTSLGWLLSQMLERDEERRPDALQALNGLERVRDELAAQRFASGGMVVTGPMPAPAPGGMGGLLWPTGQAGPCMGAPGRQWPTGQAGPCMGAPGPGPRGPTRDRLAPTVQIEERSGSAAAVAAAGGAPSLTGSQGAAPRLPGTLETDPGRAATVAAVWNTGGVAGAPGPQPTGQAWNSVTAQAPPRRTSMWLWLGPLIAVPVLIGVISLTLVLGREDPKDRPSRHEGPVAEGPRKGPREEAREEPREEPRERPREEAREEPREGPREIPRRALDPEVPREARPADATRPVPVDPPRATPTVQELVAGCKTPKDAVALFAEGKKAETSAEPEAWKNAVAYYQAVLQCGHSAIGQRLWSARLIANIFLRLKDCGAARRNWATYQQLSRAAGKRAKPFPRCP